MEERPFQGRVRAPTTTPFRACGRSPWRHEELTNSALGWRQAASPKMKDRPISRRRRNEVEKTDAESHRGRVALSGPRQRHDNEALEGRWSFALAKEFHNPNVTSDLAFHSPDISLCPCQEAQARHPRHAKFFENKILLISPSGSRFCEDKGSTEAHKSLFLKILRK